MRILILGLAAAAIATPAAAQQIGARTQTPEQLLAQSGGARDLPSEIEAQARAAAAHPLGTAQNPIRVGGPEGERAYLARLRCTNGTAPRVGARAEAGIGAYGSIVAAYEVICDQAAPRGIVMDMYHEEHREAAAPTGFTLAP